MVGAMEKTKPDRGQRRTMGWGSYFEWGDQGRPEKMVPWLRSEQWKFQTHDAHPQGKWKLLAGRS